MREKTLQRSVGTDWVFILALNRSGSILPSRPNLSLCWCSGSRD